MKIYNKKLLIKLLFQLQKRKNNNLASIAGFTLLEIVIAVLIIGILFGISATTWTAFLNEQRINQANQKIFSILQDTKTKARKQNQAYQLRFRNNGGNGLEYVITLKGSTPSESEWQSLFENEKDSIQLAFYSPNSNNITDLKTQTFNYQGLPEDTNLDVNKRIIVNPQDGTSPRKCIIIQDLLGSLRNESDAKCTTNENGNDISSNIQTLN